MDFVGENSTSAGPDILAFTEATFGCIEAISELALANGGGALTSSLYIKVSFSSFHPQTMRRTRGVSKVGVSDVGVSIGLIGIGGERCAMMTEGVPLNFLRKVTDAQYQFLVITIP